jgi:hypothetical protein
MVAKSVWETRTENAMKGSAQERKVFANTIAKVMGVAT